ncbi:MAG TPA: GTPase ObgE [Anaerolineaceae bacterium]|nr:GTPase ObgE [Anaerolineaceae bacterium]HPN52207.1 GTPase ObgE [Anaerolineaceae bacterium]
MFIDQVDIYVRSGKGGDGAVHFHREKFVPRGGPDGGDGGRGGSVVLEVQKTLNTLSYFHHKSRFIAKDGGRGGPNNMSGKSAREMVIFVPPGTMVYNANDDTLLGDLTKPGQRLEVARGGRGGRGNQHFASSRHQAPTIAEKGEPCVEMSLRLELKLIADIGLVGVPNAGKSSFLASVTNARPKIAPYPFTTLEPNLGVVELDINNVLVLADIPGLIEGAHMGVGLGFSFLRHIQRTRVLIHLLDGYSNDPVADYAQINSEMALFDPNLGKKPQLVVFNKMDMPEVAERWPQIQADLKARGVEAVPVSALTGDGIRPLLWKAAELLAQTPEPEVAPAAMPVYRPQEDMAAFTIVAEEGGFRIKGAGIERAAQMTYWEHEGSVRRFQKLMENIGVDEALRQAGVQPGDSVYILDYELEWQD